MFKITDFARLFITFGIDQLSSYHNPSKILQNAYKQNISFPSLFCQKFYKFQLKGRYKQFYQVLFVQQQAMTLRKAPKYAKISLKRRVKLIELTLKAKTSISKAAKMLGLKPSTAKLIVKRYKQEGTFFESKSSKIKRLQRIQVSQVNGIQPQNIQLVEQNGTEFPNHENWIISGFISNELPSAPITIWSPTFQMLTWMYPYGFSQGQ